MINGAPEIMLNTIDFDEDFVQMPLPLCGVAHIVGSLLAYLPGEVGSKPINPESYTIMTNIYAALMEQVFNIS